MYTDKKKRRWVWVLAVVLLVAAVAASGSWMGRQSDKEIALGSAAALKAAVQRCAHQCYVVEGVYPPDLEYLEEHYGLQVNHSKFYITYDAFASNLPPDIRVTPRVN